MKLRNEFIRGDDTLTEFKERRGLSTRFYSKARELGFLEGREKVKQKVIEKSDEASVNLWRHRFEYSSTLFDKYNKKAEKILENGNEKRDWKTGQKVVLPIDSSTLNELSMITERNLKGHKLLAGEKTGDETNINLTVQMANFVEKVEDGQGGMVIENE